MSDKMQNKINRVDKEML